MKLRKIIEDLELAEFILYPTMFISGEFMQEGHLSGLMHYNWGVGHFSDIGISGICATYLLRRTNSLKERLIIGLGIPTFFSTLEMMSYNPDYQDVLCYWIPSLLALGIKQVVSKNKSI